MDGNQESDTKFQQNLSINVWCGSVLDWEDRDAYILVSDLDPPACSE